MTTRRRTTPPVPMSPIHRRSWRSLWRRCSCGLKEPCIDRLTTPVLFLPADQPPPSPPPVQPQPPRHPDGSMVHAGIRAAHPGRAADPVDEFTAVVSLGRAARARVRRPASARVPVPQPGREPGHEPAREPGRAGSLTPAQSRRADLAERRQDVPHLREAVPGRAYDSGPPQPPPRRPSRGTDQVPPRNRPGPARRWTYDARRVGDSTS
jgi:hypothetical protein